jgi:hypothetical protein
MRVNRPIAVGVICSMFMSSFAWAGGAPGITVNLVSCAAPNTQAKIVAMVPDDAASGRVYFRANNTGDEYYVDMRRSGASMWAFLPSPSASTKTIQYRVVTRNTAGAEMASNAVSIQTRTYCPPSTYTAAEIDAMKNIVLGLTASSQSAIPNGFECQNVVRYITVAGEMRVNDYCRNILAGLPPSGAPVTAAPTTAATTGSTTAASTTATSATTASTAGSTAGATTATTAATVGGGGGLSTSTILALTAAGLLAAGVIIQENQDDDDEENSPSRP